RVRAHADPGAAEPGGDVRFLSGEQLARRPAGKDATVERVGPAPPFSKRPALSATPANPLARTLCRLNCFRQSRIKLAARARRAPDASPFGTAPCCPDRRPRATRACRH